MTFFVLDVEGAKSIREQFIESGWLTFVLPPGNYRFKGWSFGSYPGKTPVFVDRRR